MHLRITLTCAQMRLHATVHCGAQVIDASACETNTSHMSEYDASLQKTSFLGEQSTSTFQSINQHACITWYSYITWYTSRPGLGLHCNSTSIVWHSPNGSLTNSKTNGVSNNVRSSAT